VLAPKEDLVAGGPAEDFEQRIQALFKRGHRHIVADLREVGAIDSSGVRALVRGHSTAQRVSGTFRLADVPPRVMEVLTLSRLDSVLDCYRSVGEATTRPMPWAAIGLTAGVVALAALLLVGERWLPPIRSVVEAFPGVGVAPGTAAPAAGAQPIAPSIHLFELVAAGLIGLLVTQVQKRVPRDRPMQRSMEQAQVLLCVSGALMMIIIGSSLARAFGIAGAASIVRFRTPVEDPKDVTVLFLLMALGMACGMGALGIAGLGTLLLCAVLPLLDRVAGTKPRVMMAEVTASERRFPTSHVMAVFARHGIVAELREMSQGNEPAVKYHATIPPGVSLEDVSASLLGQGTDGIKSVEWEAPKRSE
jgi:anti-anti-sigma factor